MAPVKRPINPDNINPPMTPIKITNIGTGAPLPSIMGLITLSDMAAIIRYMDQREAGKTSFSENR